MNTDMSILNLVLQASPVVQVVMVILALASVMSWGVIGIKHFQLRRARAHPQKPLSMNFGARLIFLALTPN